jgi:hypothetical protein
MWYKHENVAEIKSQFVETAQQCGGQGIQTKQLKKGRWIICTNPWLMCIGWQASASDGGWAPHYPKGFIFLFVSAVLHPPLFASWEHFFLNVVGWERSLQNDWPGVQRILQDTHLQSHASQVLKVLPKHEFKSCIGIEKGSKIFILSTGSRKGFLVDCVNAFMKDFLLDYMKHVVVDVDNRARLHKPGFTYLMSKERR